MATRPREVWLGANGLRFRGLEWEGAGPGVLLLHATSFCAEVWRPVWETARAGAVGELRAVAVDQRGHGRSDAPDRPESYAWPELAEDVLALVRALREGRPRTGLEQAGTGTVLVGHSSGATAALAAAARSPQEFAAVVAIEPVLFDPPAAAAEEDSFAGSRLLAERARKRRVSFASRAEAARVLRARFPYSGFDPSAFGAYLDGGFEPAANGSLSLRCRPEREAWAYEGAAALDLWPAVGRIRARVLLVLGEHGAVPLHLLERLRSGLRDVRLACVPGATHFASLERPSEVGRLLDRHLPELGVCSSRPSAGSM